jgi:hypothetical protein
MPSSHILNALDTLSKAVDAFETALTKAEARVKSSNGKKSKTNQIDLFELLVIPAEQSESRDPHVKKFPDRSSSVRDDEISERLGRVIAQIEDVLQQAA